MAIPPWEKKLQKASLRGIALEVDERDESGGRNTHTHEWVDSQDVLTEDLGRKADGFSVTAYLWGDDYLDQLDKLRKAVKEPGSCDYVDPWLGRLVVNVKAWRFVERKKKGGWVDITLDLIEAGTKAPMAATIDTARLVEDEADNTLPVLADDFGHGFDADGPSFLADDALGILGEAGGMLGQISGRLAVVGRPLGLVQRGLSSFTGNLSSLIGMPSLLGGQLQGLMRQVLSLSGTGKSRFEAANQMASFGGSRSPVAPTTPNRVRQADNHTAIADLVRRTALVEAARASAQMDYPLREDAVAARTGLTTRLAAETSTARDGVKLPLRRLSAAVSRDITVRGTGLASLGEITPDATLPSLVLAHRYLGNARRSGELLARNPQIRNPLLVPGGRPLRVVVASNQMNGGGSSGG
ncbi:MAG: DNA circularization N-terminal domain-containing protein [Alphaproteobacteria bacterium]|nr:DNA circularization N-terminal domain-containing protein [Alphaproteobacteria bacterium]